MPIYQYVCTECGEPLEVSQAFTDAPLTECPRCHGRLRKQFSSVGVVFKGSGFYRTDARAAGGTTTSNTTSTKAADTRPVDSKPGDSKPGDSKPGDSKPGGSKKSAAPAT